MLYFSNTLQLTVKEGRKISLQKKKRQLNMREEKPVSTDKIDGGYVFKGESEQPVSGTFCWEIHSLVRIFPALH